MPAPKWLSPGLAVLAQMGLWGEFHWLWLSLCCSPALLLDQLVPVVMALLCAQVGNGWIIREHITLIENGRAEEEILSDPPNKIRVLQRARVHKKWPGLPGLLLIHDWFMTCTLQLSHEGGFMECRGCLQPPLSGSSWDGKSDSQQTSQVLLHLHGGGRGTEGQYPAEIPHVLSSANWN